MKITERDWLETVLSLAALFGWKTYHVPMPVRPIPGGKFVAERRGAGLPDLILFHEDPPRLIFAELKGETGHPLSPEQREFLRLANGLQTPPVEMGVRGYVWTPADREQVESILKSRVLV